MKVKSKYESTLVLEKMEIVECEFRKKDAPLNELELNVQVSHSISELGENRHEVILITIVADVDETIYVRVKGRAIFNVRQGSKEVFEKNTIAIMFPYIRSYISIITTQPGMTPIVLPAMNIVAMLNDQGK